MYHGYIHIAIKRKLVCSGYVERDPKHSCIYWIVLKHESISHGLIAHEIVHLSNMIMEDRDIKPDYNNDESQAYLVEWLTESVYKVLKRLNRLPR